MNTPIHHLDAFHLEIQFDYASEFLAKIEGDDEEKLRWLQDGQSTEARINGELVSYLTGNLAEDSPPEKIEQTVDAYLHGAGLQHEKAVIPHSKRCEWTADLKFCKLAVRMAA